MPSIASAVKEEIARLVRKELKANRESLKKALAHTGPRLQNASAASRSVKRSEAQRVPLPSPYKMLETTQGTGSVQRDLLPTAHP